MDPPLPPGMLQIFKAGDYINDPNYVQKLPPLPASPVSEALDPFREVKITNPDYKLGVERIHHRNKHDHHGKPKAEDNLVDRFELFTLAEGEKKVEEVADTREWFFSPSSFFDSLDKLELDIRKGRKGMAENCPLKKANVHVLSI